MIIDTLTDYQLMAYYDSLPLGPELSGSYTGRVHQVPFFTRVTIGQLWRGKVFAGPGDVINRIGPFYAITGDVWRTPYETIIDYPKLGLRDTIRYSGDFYLGRLALPLNAFLWFTLTPDAPHAPP